MGVQTMNCPKCGKPASEYATNKWQCLHCSTRFIYEPPAQPHEYGKVETIISFADNTFFECDGCHGKFPEIAHAKYSCKTCGGTFCRECMEAPGLSMRCKKCANKIVAAVMFLIILLVFVLALVLYYSVINHW